MSTANLAKDFKTGRPPVVLDLRDQRDQTHAFAWLGKFQSCARRAGWTDAQVTEVLDEAKAGDYDHLIATIMSAVVDVKH